MSNITVPRISVNSDSADRLAEFSSALPMRSDLDRDDAGAQQMILKAFQHGCRKDFVGVVSQILDALDRRPHCVLVSGLSFDSQNALFTALSASLGRIGEPSRQARSPLIRELTPAPDSPQDRLLLPGTDVAVESLHTDGTGWPQPNDYSCLLCVHADQHGGGRSRLLDAESITANLWQRARRAVEILEHPIPWRKAGELGGGVHWAPVFEETGIRWLPLSIDRSLNAEHQLQREVCWALDELTETIENSGAVVETGLERNELLIVGNKRCLHARTPIPHPEISCRLLLRSRVWCHSVPNSL